MDLFRRSRFLAAAVTSVLLLSVVAFAATDSAVSTRADPDAEFRATLIDFYTEFELAYAPFARIGPAGLMEMAARARASVPSMSRQELAVLRDGLPPSTWRTWKMTVIPALKRAQKTAPALEAALVASIGPFTPSASPMSHSCPAATIDADAAKVLEKAFIPTDDFKKALTTAREFELGAQIAYNVASADPTGIAIGTASAPLGFAMAARYVLEKEQARSDACEAAEHERILHDELAPGMKAVKDSLKALDKLDVEVSSRASQVSLDGRANGIEALTNARANQLEALLKARADFIDSELKRRTDYIDAYQANVVAHRQVDLQVLQIERGRLLVITTEAGQAVRATVTSVKVSDLKKGPASFQEVRPTTQVTEGAPGVLEIALDMKGPAKDADAYLISVAHAHGQVIPVGNVTHTGMTIFRRNGD